MNKNFLRVATYLRLSDEDRNKINKSDNSESIKNQRHMLNDYIKNNSNFIFIDEYCDEDLSGAGTYRPEFERLIHDCELRKIDVVLCKSQSRFSRDMEIVERYLNNKFNEWGIRFISLSDNADTENPGNKKSRQINGLINEWYLEDISNNIRSAFNAKMKQGEFISPFAPFGYEVSSKNNNKLVIDEYASKIVKDIYNLYLKGYGYLGIAKYLNNHLIPSPSLYKYQKGIKLHIISNKPREDIKWNSNAIKTILTNKVYLGHLIQGKRTTISYKNHKIINKDKTKWISTYNTHDPIIEIETFNKVAEEIKKRTKSKNNLGIIHNLSGKVICLECNHSLRKKSTSKHNYLVCSNIYNNCSNTTSIRYDVLETLILNELNKLLTKYYNIAILTKIDNQNNNKHHKLISLENIKTNLLKNISQNKTYLKNLYEDRVNNNITLEDFKYLSNLYTQNNLVLSNQLLSLSKDINTLKQLNNISLLKKYQKFNQLNRLIITEFINNIFIGKVNKETNTRDIIINWNI